MDCVIVVEDIPFSNIPVLEQHGSFSTNTLEHFSLVHREDGHQKQSAYGEACLLWVPLSGCFITYIASLTIADFLGL